MKTKTVAEPMDCYRMFRGWCFGRHIKGGWNALQVCSSLFEDGIGGGMKEESSCSGNCREEYCCNDGNYSLKGNRIVIGRHTKCGGNVKNEKSWNDG